jgi:hypothetical protein
MQKVISPNISSKVFPLMGIALSAVLCSDAIAAGLNFDAVTKSIFDPLFKMLETNMQFFLLLGALGGGFIAQGDMRTRAIGVGSGFITAAIVWKIATAMAGVSVVVGQQ